MRPALIGLALIYVALTADAAEQQAWQGFYKPSTPTARPASVLASDVCLRAIMEAQQRHDIPDNLLLAIGIQEAGRKVDGKLTVWPWTANANGKGIFFEDKAALEAWVQDTQARGVQSIDVGCMQVNQRWHARQFASLAEATDPVANVDYAARFLRSLQAETGDWWEAAGRYHSTTPAYKDVYLAKLAQNQRLANKARVTLADAPAKATPRPVQPGVYWTSDMTGSDALQLGDVHSIYSATPLQPLLPNYAQAD